MLRDRKYRNDLNSILLSLLTSPHLPFRRGNTHLALRSRRIRHLLRYNLEIDPTQEIHLPGVNPHDVYPGRERRVWELDLAIDSSRSKESRVQNVNPICRHDNLAKTSAHTSRKGQGDARSGDG